MMKRLLVSTAAASLLTIGTAAGIALAQDSSGTTNSQAGQPAVVVPQPMNNSDSGGATMAPGADTTNGTGSSAAGSSAEATPATPPPADAVISAQKDDEVRADQLIGATVYNNGGDKIGTVHDIILDKNGKATGVVLSVGGLMGIGAKSVGLNWSEVDLKPDQQAVQVSYTKDQLEAAPDFKTTDQIQSEMNAQAPQPTTPAPGGGTNQPQ
ncbi:MAG TPA: PRC-barrel domain-containing protein [Dongiaceae bacterium]|jgi:sporulation protein YlmC with PRC-barrel domain